MPSVNSSSRPKVWPSSTFTTPSLPTFSSASERTSPISVERDVAALRAERHLDRVGQGVDAALERPACVLVELELLVSHVSFLSSSLDRCAVADDLRQDVRLAEDQNLVGAELDLGAAVLAEDDLVALVEVHGV